MRLPAFLIAITWLLGCSGGSPPGAGPVDAAPDALIVDAGFESGGRDRGGPMVWDIERQPPPALVTANYIDLSRIARVSLFRSSVGHDYWDDFERCRSMKHYFVPADQMSAGSIAITAPLDAEVARIDPEWAGVQLHLRSRIQPEFTVILFHVTLSPALAVGDRVTAGQALGTHVGPQTGSDVAVAVDSPGGRRLISYFDLVDESTWAGYVQRGIASRRDLVITRDERDADPLQCEGEKFLTAGTLPQWRDLR